MYEAKKTSGGWNKDRLEYIEEYTVTNGTNTFPLTVTIDAPNIPGEATLYSSKDKKDKICSFPHGNIGRFSENTRILLDALNALPEDADPAAQDSPVRTLRFIRNLYGEPRLS